MDSIKSRARHARVALKRILEAEWDSPATVQQDIEEADGNFTLWTVNLGVFDSGHSSLDYRLQEVPEAADLIKNLLDDLIDHAQGLNILAADDDQGDYGESLPVEERSDGESNISFDADDEFGELDARVMSIKDVVLRLFRLARSIRNYSTRSAQGRRNIYSTYPSQDRTKIMENLFQIEKHRIVDYIHDLRRDWNRTDDERVDTLSFEEVLPGGQSGSGSVSKTGGEYEDQPSTPEKLETSRQQDQYQLLESSAVLGEEDELLIDRLAKANSRRRQQFIYWRHRHQASVVATEVSHEESVGPGPGAASPIPRGNSAVQPQALDRAVSMPSSATKLKREQINLAERVSVASGISRPPSARGPGGTPAEWPLAPAEIPEGPYFACPYCYNLCPQRYRSKEGWKSHLMHDLKPYCCTYNNCESGDQLYDSWADWTSHEMLVHNKVWTCLEHPDEEYRSVEEYCRHIHHAHLEDADAMQTPQIISARATGSRSSGRACPFCLAGFDIAGDLHRHIAWHLETIALGALPRSTGLEVGSQEGGERNSAAQDHGDEDSRAGQFDDLPLPDTSEPLDPLADNEPYDGDMRQWTSLPDVPEEQSTDSEPSRRDKRKRSTSERIENAELDNTEEQGGSAAGRRSSQVPQSSINGEPDASQLQSLIVSTIRRLKTLRSDQEVSTLAALDEADKVIQVADAFLKGTLIPAIYVRALYDYTSDDQTSLSFDRGDIIQVITKLESGWWNGLLEGVRGWFPSNYCIELWPEDIPPDLQARNIWKQALRVLDALHGVQHVQDPDHNAAEAIELYSSAPDKIYFGFGKRTGTTLSLGSIIFPPGSIGKGDIFVGQLRTAIAIRLSVDIEDVHMMYNARTLSSDDIPLKDEHVSTGSDIDILLSTGTVLNPEPGTNETHISGPDAPAAIRTTSRQPDPQTKSAQIAALSDDDDNDDSDDDDDEEEWLPREAQLQVLGSLRRRNSRVSTSAPAKYVGDKTFDASVRVRRRSSGELVSPEMMEVKPHTPDYKR